MPSRIVERIKGVKDKIFSILESIKDDQSRLMVDQAGLKSQIDRLNQLMEGFSDLPEKVEEQTRQLDDYGKQLAEYDRRVAPINDAYSYPAEIATYRKANPEIMLLQYLRTFVQTNNVVDIGVHTGNCVDQLLSAGYRVFAFEPQPDSFDTLSQRFQGAQTFRAFEVAVSAQDGSANLYKVNVDSRARDAMSDQPSTYSTLVQHPLPYGAKYGERLEVKLRCLRGLHDSGELPGDVSIVKIDTQGGDLDVIRGMGATKYAIVMTTFWDGAYPLSGGEYGLLAPMVLHMRNRGYPWHIVVYRVFHGTHSTEPRYYCNIDQSVRQSWGNALFFRDYDLFSEAQKWCAAMMAANQSFGL